MTDAETNKWCIFSGKEGADTGLRMTGNAGRKQKKGGKLERDGGAVLAWSFFNVCVPRVYKSESGSVLQGRCFLQCNLSLWWNV